MGNFSIKYVKPKSLKMLAAALASIGMLQVSIDGITGPMFNRGEKWFLFKD